MGLVLGNCANTITIITVIGILKIIPVIPHNQPQNERDNIATSELMLSALPMILGSIIFPTIT